MLPPFTNSIDFEDMSVRFGAFKLGIPRGFKLILEQLTREILREQPEQLLPFITSFLNDLLEKRERERFAVAAVVCLCCMWTAYNLFIRTWFLFYLCGVVSLQNDCCRTNVFVVVVRVKSNANVKMVV